MRLKNTNRRGQTAVLFTLAIIPLFGIIGLAVDIGWTQFRRVAAQTAADAAATGAALAAYQAANGGTMLCATAGIACYATETPCPSTLPTTPANNIQVGCMYARDNGFVTTGRQRVTFQSGVGAAPSAAGVTTSYWVVVRVSENVPQLFSSVLGHPMASITVSATTGAREGTAGGCVITLNQHGSASINTNGTTNLTSGCGVFVNSDASDAITLVGGAQITTTGTAKTEIVGSWNGSGTISPAPVLHVPYQGDPMADLVPPTVGSCTSAVPSTGPHGTTTISPGCFPAGINLDSQRSLILNPGLYIIRNGISLGGQTSISGTGVTIYVETGGVTMAGGASVSLSAPSTGDWQGVLFFQARGNATESTLVGGTTQQMNGALYFPSSHLNYTGGSSVVSTATTLISDTLTLVGISNISASANTRFSGTQGGVSLIQ